VCARDASTFAAQRLQQSAGVRALVVTALLVATACSGGAGPGPAAGASGSAPAGAKAVWPLRGGDAPNADATKRRPVVVRVPNDPAARPQAGLGAADLVFEMLVEGGITRYAVVFHSQDAEKVGPIRSARLSDLHYMPMLRGILAHVGAQGTVLQRIRDAAKSGRFIDVDQFEHASAFDRVSERAAPQNVYTSTKRIREAAKDDAKVDVPPLAFGTAPGGTAFTSFVVPYSGTTRVEYTAQSSGFKRAQGGQPTVDDATKQEVTPTNVVVIKTEITEVPGLVEDEHGSLSLEIRSTGTGPAVVLSDGKRFNGTWERNGDGNYSFKDAGGAAIALRPGLTWIHVVPLSFELGT